MQIIELQIRNVKRISAVEIKPDGSLVTVRGKNGAVADHEDLAA